MFEKRRDTQRGFGDACAARVFLGADEMDQKQSVALEIALQTHVLRACPLHHQLFCDDEADAANAFGLAVELVRQRTPCVDAFSDDAHALTELLSDTIAAAPSTVRSARSPPPRSTTPEAVLPRARHGGALPPGSLFLRFTS